MTVFTIGGVDAVDRIVGQVQWNCMAHGVEEPSVAQIGVVLRALADHTSLTQAVRCRPDPDFEPEATSVGRWLHAYADACRERAREEGQ